MPLRPVDDSDPLLAFDNERGAAESSAPPLEPGVQPVAAAADPSPIQQPPESHTALAAKVESLERELDQSKSQVSTLQSEMATLVRTIADIRRQRSQPPAAIPALKSRARLAAAVAGLAIGITLGVGGWLYFESAGDVSIASPATPVSAQTVSAEGYVGGLAPNVAPTPEGYVQGLAPNVARTPVRYERGQPPDVAPAPQAPKAPPAPPAPQAPRYVGTLSIDADPGGDVFVDRKPAGHTPLRLPNLRAGSHLIWIERDGYRRFTRVVQVPSDRVTRVSAELEPIVR